MRKISNLRNNSFRLRLLELEFTQAPNSPKYQIFRPITTQQLQAGGFLLTLSVDLERYTTVHYVSSDEEFKKQMRRNSSTQVMICVQRPDFSGRLFFRREYV